MFEHLDDPQPYAASEGLRSAVVAAGGRLRRRRRRRLVGGGVVALVVVVLAGAWAYVDRRDAAIDRVEVATQPSVDGAVNILLVGLDVAEVPPGGVGGRADALVLVRIDGATVRVVSIPRDVAVPATGQRLSEVAVDGLDATVAGVSAVLGDAPVDHVIEIGFDGFVALVDALGGVAVSVPRPFVDHSTGVDLAPSGCTRLDGATALGVARSRHVEGDPTGDLGRIARQQVVLAGLGLALADADIDAVSRVLADHAIVDDGLTLARLAELVRRAISYTSISSQSLPVSSATRSDGAAILVPSAEVPSELLDLGATGPIGAPSADVVVGGRVDDVLDPGLTGATGC